jgi:hypothetical protein
VSPEALAQVRGRGGQGPTPAWPRLSTRSPPLALQGLDNTTQRVAVHADACLARFEQWAVGQVFARPAALDDTPAGEAAAAAAFTAQEETDLDARLHAARCRLAAVRRRGVWVLCCVFALCPDLSLRPQARASVAAMQAECTSLDAELASSQVAVAQLESLAAAAGAKENAATTATQLVVALTEFVPLLDTAEALAAQGTAACGAPALPDGVCFVSTQPRDGSHITDARLLSSSP